MRRRSVAEITALIVALAGPPGPFFRVISWKIAWTAVKAVMSALNAVVVAEVIISSGQLHLQILLGTQRREGVP